MLYTILLLFFFFSSRRRHTRYWRDWSSDVCSSDLDRTGGSDDEVVFVPALAGLGAPFWAPEARGAWLGLSLATRRGELVRAVVLGIAAQIASLARAVGEDTGRPLGRLRVDGGLTRS